MTSKQFQSVRNRPFLPLTIHTASGEAYTVTHPESIWQEPEGTTVIIAIRGEGVVMLDTTLISEVKFGSKKPTTKE